MHTSTARPSNVAQHQEVAPPFPLTTFPNDTRYDELVVVANIAFVSACADG